MRMAYMMYVKIKKPAQFLPAGSYLIGLSHFPDPGGLELEFGSTSLSSLLRPCNLANTQRRGLGGEGPLSFLSSV